MRELTVRETDEKKWGLYIGDRLLADSKARVDADHAKQLLLGYINEILGVHKPVGGSGLGAQASDDAEADEVPYRSACC